MTSIRARTAAPLTLLVLVFAAACGDNLFAPGPEGGRPSINELTARGPDAATPDTLAEGETLLVDLSASASRSITHVTLLLRGALVKDTTIALASPGRDVDGTFSVLVPGGTGPDSLLYVTATVMDAAEQVSEPASDTVFIVDATPPQVSSAVTPTTVGSGDDIEISVQASDSRGLWYVGYIVTNGADTLAMGADTLATPMPSYERTFTLAAPQIDVTTLRVEAYAVDVSGLRSGTPGQNVVLTDMSGPIIEIIETSPDSTIPLGASVEVTTRVVDPTGIRRLIFIGLSPRGDPDRGTDTLVVRFPERVITYPRPGQTTMPREVLVTPLLTTPDDTTTEPVTIIVLAEDSLGNISEVTKDMYVGGPDVTLTYPPSEFATGLGADFNVRARIEDASGIDSAVVLLSGAVTQRIQLALPPRTDTAFTLIQNVVMPSAPGVVNIQVRAWNPDEVGGQSRVSTVSVLADAPTDTTPPVVSVTAQALVPGGTLPRMELTDRIRITVSAFDAGAGLARMGFTIVAARGGTVYTINDDVTFNGSRNLEELDWIVPLDSLYALFGITDAAAVDALLPDEIDLRIHAFAADTVGEFACSVGIEEQRACTPDTYSPTGFYEAAGTDGLQVRITAVRGHTVLLESQGALIADLAVDTLNERLFLSNISHNLVELLDLAADPRQNTFRDPVQVGSRPWGLFIGDRVVSATDAAFIGGLAAVGDTVGTLIVSNSGGTNMSLVHLHANHANVQEVDVVRLFTPNAVLYEIQENINETGGISYSGIFIDFSDRPQFLAQDSLLRIVYSTVPTTAANTSTVRYVAVDPDPTSAADVPEVRFLLTADMVNTESTSTLALANIDSLYIEARAGETDRVRVFTHEPGYPQNVIFNATLEPQIADAVADVITQIDAVMTARGVPEQAPLYYPFFRRGSWDLDRVGMSDTTFVSASTDRGKVAIGEGASAPTGRIILWDGANVPTMSTNVEIADLISNASERVLGVGLNYDGSLGVARGLESTYFFTPDLRLQGLYQQEKQGGAGAAFHPDHNSVFNGGHNDASGAGAAFTGTPTHSIEVVNTFHFNRITELFIRDNIIGPLRTGPPLSTDNNGQGRACVGDDCVVAKLYGITDAGGVVIVNVRRRDLQ